MNKQVEILGIIPARGGSKGIKKKNIIPLEGKPLIAWTIEAALNADSISRLIVTTEDDEIAETARKFGAEIPFKRPDELAGDNVGGLDPIVHALEWLKEHENYSPDYFMLLQPTSPLRTSEDIEKAVAITLESNANNLISISEIREHPCNAMMVDEQGMMKNFLGVDLNDLIKKYPRRQDLPPAYIENGAVYLSRTETFLKNRSFYDPAPHAMVMSKENSVDIDNMLNLYVAESILRSRPN
jgi:N-acylneuraminate cytidylyltransferase/CMP-N,N'-diacetyllegionaminic acid synthase